MADILDLEFALGGDGHVSDEGIPKMAAVEPETDTRFNRTRQIRLTETQDDAIANEAKKRGLSAAALIRECIDRALPRTPKDPAEPAPYSPAGFGAYLRAKENGEI